MKGWTVITTGVLVFLAGSVMFPVSGQTFRGQSRITAAPSHTPRSTYRPTRATENEGQTESEIVAKWVSQMKSRVQRRLANYERFLDKLRAVRTRLTDEGRDVTRLTNLMNGITAKLITLRSTVSSVNTQLTSLEATSIRDAMQQFAPLRQELRAAFTDLHSSMADFVGEIQHTQVQPTRRPTRR